MSDNLSELLEATEALGRLHVAESVLEQLCWDERGQPRPDAIRALDSIGDLRRSLEADITAHSTDIRAGVVE